MKNAPKPKATAPARAKRPPPPGAGTEQARKMGRINQDVAKASSLVAANPMNALATTYPEAMKQAKEHIGFGMQALTAAVAMKDLSDQQLAQTHAYIKSTGDAVDEAGKFARARVLDAALKRGNAIGATGGSRELDLGDGMVQRVTLQKTGIDPKKFEAALRAKNAPVGEYMATVVTYVMLEGNQSADRALSAGIFTAGELEALKYEPTYRVERMAERKKGGES